MEKYFRQNDKRYIVKWKHYFDIYERHFSKFRNKEVVILEIGVFQGGSLQMWKDYFGEKASIYGIDIDPKCKEFEEENIKVFIGSQSDRKFLRELKKQIPPIDILIDDGGHTMLQQTVTFEEMFDHVKKNGIYLCEDLLSSYQLAYGGGYKRQGTFIEYSKNFIDYINAFHSEQKTLKVNNFTKSVDSVHYYDSIIIIEKKERERPIVESTGKMSGQSSSQANQPISKKINFYLLFIINKCLQFFRLKGFIWR